MGPISVEYLIKAPCGTKPFFGICSAHLDRSVPSDR